MFVVLVYLQLFSTELSSCLKHFHHIISNSFFFVTFFAVRKYQQFLGLWNTLPRIATASRV